MSKTYALYADEANIEKDDPINFIEWLIDVKRVSVGPDTWRLYRNAVASTMEINQRWNDPEIQQKISVLRKTKGLTKKAAQPITGRPLGGSKVVSLSQDQLSQLASILKSKRYQYGPMTLAWFKSLLITGMRPNEWPDAQIKSNGNEDVLEIKNLKVVDYDDPSLERSRETQRTRDSSGRGLFMYRTIPLSQFTENERKFIVEWIGVLKGIVQGIQSISDCSTEAAQKAAYQKARRTIYEASRDVSGLGEGKNITLYTARHMFRSRNMTALLQDGYNEEQASMWLAVLMGHGSKKSNYAYGLESDVGGSAAGAIGIESLGEDKAALARQILTRYS